MQGDLNYRIEGSRGAIEHVMAAGLPEVLESNDQARTRPQRARLGGERLAALRKRVPGLNASFSPFVRPPLQLLREREAGRVFAGFREGPLHFRPTFKFDLNSNQCAPARWRGRAPRKMPSLVPSVSGACAFPLRRYDTSRKGRVPAWTDRILFICPKDRSGHQRTGINLRTYGAR